MRIMFFAKQKLTMAIQQRFWGCSLKVIYKEFTRPVGLNSKTYVLSIGRF